MTTMTMKTRISVWYDSTSDAHGWIVSRDTDTTTDTLVVCSSRDEALAAARECAREGESVVELPKFDGTDLLDD